MGGWEYSHYRLTCGSDLSPVENRDDHNMGREREVYAEWAQRRERNARILDLSLIGNAFDEGEDALEEFDDGSAVVDIGDVDDVLLDEHKDK